jgi:hypothetical protein
MKRTMQFLIGLVGLLNIVIGLSFLFNPAKMAAEFAISPLGTQGMATMRADFPAFFLTGAVFSLIGAWRADRLPLMVPLMLLTFALLGRFVSIAFEFHNSIIPIQSTNHTIVRMKRYIVIRLNSK